MNSLLSLMDKFSPMANAISQAKGIAKAIQGGNPLDLIGQNDPKMQQVNQFIASNGGNAEAAFYALAKQKGVDPNEILSQVKGILNM